MVHRGGPLLVVAGAGSGKTRVLTRRIAHLLATGDAPPWGILAITFTNKAAEEMRNRVAELVGPAGREDVGLDLPLRRACAFCAATPTVWGTGPSFTVYDDTDTRRLIEMIVAEMGLDTKRLPPRSVAAVIGQAKAELIDFETFRESARQGPDPFQRKIADVYAEYQQRLLAANALDFDDLLMVTANLLQACDDVRESYQERFSQILVDEFQDTNHAQNEIVHLLGQEHGNVCVVGDSDQSVYKWRGADIRNILEFEQAFPSATIIVLEQNFRSTQTILNVANAVIANNLDRPNKQLFTVGDAGDPVLRYRAEDERDEASWVSGEILRLRAAEALAWGDIAVFYRTNAQSRALEDSFIFTGIPYKVVGGAKFYDRREVKDVLAYIRVLANPDDEVSARRIVNVPKRGIGDTSVARLAAWAQVQPGVVQRGHRPGRGSRARRQGAQGGRATLEDAGRAPPAGLHRQPGGFHPAGGRPHRLHGRAGGRAHPRVGRAHREHRRAGQRGRPVRRRRRLPRDGGPGGRLRRPRRRRHQGFVDDPAHGQGPGVPGRVRGRPRRRDLPPPALARASRPTWRRSGGSSMSASPGPAGISTCPTPGRAPSSAGRSRTSRAASWARSPPSWSKTSGWSLTRQSRNLSTDRRSGDGRWRLSTAGDAVRRRAPFLPSSPLAPRPSGPRASSGAEDLGLVAGDRVVHDHWGPGVVLDAKGEGSRAQATVDFESVGKKNLLLSATPLRRA